MSFIKYANKHIFKLLKIINGLPYHSLNWFEHEQIFSCKEDSMAAFRFDNKQRPVLLNFFSFLLKALVEHYE